MNEEVETVEALQFLNGGPCEIEEAFIGVFLLARRIGDGDHPRNTVDHLTELAFARPQGILSPLPIVDVSSRCIPSDEFSSLVSQGVVLD